MFPRVSVACSPRGPRPTAVPFQSYLRAALIELAERPDVGEVLERIRERKVLAGTRLRAASILRYRDADRR